PFNLGEVTVTRAAVKLASGETGYGHILGRDRHRAHLVACFDALWQRADHRADVEDAVIRPVRRQAADADATTTAETAATRVNFFTMVRGEDT
ncbi:MAG: phosphonate C-P lyase system protein PhnG, partial [bacterium]|nr:phosphonate C-P lyase system protein PhnG [bacterium]